MKSTVCPASSLSQSLTIFYSVLIYEYFLPLVLLSLSLFSCLFLNSFFSPPSPVFLLFLSLFSPIILFFLLSSLSLFFFPPLVLLYLLKYSTFCSVFYSWMYILTSSSPNTRLVGNSCLLLNHCFTTLLGITIFEIAWPTVQWHWVMYIIQGQKSKSPESKQLQIKPCAI